MRAFVAINFPEAIRSDIWNVTNVLRDGSFPVRWVAQESLHLTLKFLGELLPSQEPAIVDGVRAAADGTKPFSITVSGFGAFPSLKHPRVVWVGCEGVAPLELLQHRLEQQMATLGFEVEGRPFRPHVTLGRARKEARARDFEGLAETVDGLHYEAVALVDSVDLMQSELRRDGARYRVRHRVELRQ